ncbi:MAG: hypothetical protein GX111_13070, partial [Clostridiales bacterium]|nr:hypothetical protein [Clostridiales bacterium]
MTLVFSIYIISLKNKEILHRLFVGITLAVFLWTVFSLLQVYVKALFDYSGMVLTNIYFSAAGFVSFFLFYIGYTFSHPDKILKLKHYALFIFPIMNAVMIWTNDFHHLYFFNFSEISSHIVRGPYFNFELFISFTLVLLSWYFLLSFTIRNSGFFSKQSILIIIGTIVPLVVDVAFVAQLYEFPAYFEPISFSFSVVCFAFAIFRFGLLNIIPIALQTVVDHISDSYIVVNERSEIIDFNRPFIENVQDITSVTRKDSLEKLFKNLDNISFVKYDGFAESIREARETKRTVSFENQYIYDGIEKTFTVEITPIYTQDRFRGTVIVMKDITEQRKSYEMIRQAQIMLIESEHMASLGQLVGGIAHNLKTPIMSIAGGLIGLSDLIDEYDESVGDDGITVEDHREIAGEMRGWIDKLKEYTAYMSDIISTVKGQAVQLTASTTDCFTLKELIKRVDILMNHE